MGRIAKWTAAALAAGILSVPLGATAALAGDSTGVSTMRPFSDGGWSPAAVSMITRQPLSDGSWSPQATSAHQVRSESTTGSTGVSTMRPFSDAGWAPPSGVFTMRPFSDPNAIGHDKGGVVAAAAR